MDTIRRSGPSLAGNVVLLGAMLAAGSLYAATGGDARTNLISTLFINVVLVLGFQVFIGNTGVLSFGHLGFAAIAAYAFAITAIPPARKPKAMVDAPFDLATVELTSASALALGILLALVIGALVGLVVARTSGLSATMITLAFVFIVEEVILARKAITGGQTLSNIPKLDGIGWQFGAALLAVGVAVLFRHSRVGRLAVATREDELAADAIGIHTYWPRWTAFVVSVGLVALGGVLTARNLGTISPRLFGFDLTIPVMAMLVVGGMRTVSGAIAGAAFMTVGKEFARFLGGGPEFLGISWPKFEGLPDLFLAGSLLIVLLLRPSGLLGDRDAGDLAGRGRILGGRRAPVGSDDGAQSDNAAGVSATSGATLTVDTIGVQFGGFTALDSVDLSVAAGQVHGLIGPNGAGKTTLINVITGIVQPTTGALHLDGTAVIGPPHRRAQLGIARTFQNLRLFGALSVRDNVDIAGEVARQHRAGRPAVGTDELLALCGLADAADRPATTLDYGNQRRLEIARAAALRPSLLLLDEPTSGMSESESLVMVDHIRSVADRIAASVLVIDHDLGFITRVADHITVLDQGRVIASGTPAEVQRDPAVIAAYLGSSAPVTSMQSAATGDG
jgi:branched-chain amino acid transport system permease protein